MFRANSILQTHSIYSNFDGEVNLWPKTKTKTQNKKKTFNKVAMVELGRPDLKKYPKIHLIASIMQCVPGRLATLLGEYGGWLKTDWIWFHPSHLNTWVQDLGSCLCNGLMVYHHLYMWPLLHVLSYIGLDCSLGFHAQWFDAWKWLNTKQFGCDSWDIFFSFFLLFEN